MPYGDDIEMKDIVANPKKFGAPTFEEYCRNRDKFSPTMTEKDHLAAIDNGGQNLKRYTKCKVFEVLGQQFNSLEKAEKFCREYGIPIKDWKVVASNMGGQFAEEKVIIMPPEDFEKRQGW